MLDKRYRIVGSLGRGGMGEVYRADDLTLGQPVALKFLPEGFEHDPKRLNRLLHEVRIARQVTHPNVCRVYDIHQVDAQHYLSMEYVDGEDLSSLLRRVGHLPGDKALQFARQLCEGLQAAHEQGILHRDLKPANVMIDGRGRAKIADFGLASLQNTTEGAEIRSGTPAYMAPEQLSGKEVTVRSDIYALGLVFYEMFTGKRAFGERGSLDSSPTNPASHVEGFDPRIAKAILRCLDTEPRGRPDSALALASALPGEGASASVTGARDALPDNLPNPVGPLFGRAAELGELTDLVAEDRVVTLTGPGGVGKTRTAIEVCRKLRPEFPGGVCFVSMAAVTEAREFVPALAAALDVKQDEQRDLSAGVASLIGDKKALLLLDNVEQVVSAAPDVAAVLSECPALRIVVTSRAPLRIDEERQYPLAPLSLPDNGDRESLESLLSCPAIALFAENAKRANRGFELTPHNAADVLAICRRLDGLPLALELAAARVRLLPPRALLERLDRALEVLTVGSRDRPERHQTLRATIDWSHSLLSEEESKLFRRLSVFSGGCTIDGIEATSADQSPSLLDGLESLIDKGLVQVEGVGDRFVMLQTVREFAREQLEAAKETEEIEDRHGRYYLELARQLRDGLEGGDQVGWIQRRVVEEANFHDVLDRLSVKARAGDREAVDRGLRMCGHHWLYWHIRGKHISAREYTQSFLDASSGEPSLGRSEALLTCGLTYWTLGQFDKGNAAWLESYRIAEQLKLERELVLAAFCLGIGHLGEDLEQASRWSQEAVELGRSQENIWARAFALTFNGVLHELSGDPQTAESRFSEALEIQRSVGDLEGAGLSLTGLGQLAATRGYRDQSTKLYEEALHFFEAIGDRAEEARVLGELGWAHLKFEVTSAARQRFFDALAAYQDIASVRGVGWSLVGLAAVESLEGHPRRALQIAAAAELFASREGIVNLYTEANRGEAYIDKARSALAREDVDEATAHGRSLSVKQAIRLARDR